MLRKAYLNTMQGLEAGLKVRDIAVFGLTTCWPDETVETVLRRVAPFDFDNVPVRNRVEDNGDGPVVGVVETVSSFDPGELVADCMRPLQEPMLISGSVSLVEILPRIAERPYRLVLEGERVMGVVTPSDVVQLPVRLLVFTLLVHLEETMRSLIRWRVGDEAARDALSADRGAGSTGPSRSSGRTGSIHCRLTRRSSPIKPRCCSNSGWSMTTRRTGRCSTSSTTCATRSTTPAGTRRTRQVCVTLRHVELLQSWIERLTQLFPEDALTVPEM
jgi:CBS domain-containing protein